MHKLKWLNVFVTIEKIMNKVVVILTTAEINVW